MAVPNANAFWRCPSCGTRNPSAGYVTLCVACGAPRKSAGRARLATVEVESPHAADPPVRGRLLLAASWSYAAFVLVLLLLIRWFADAWWGVTILLFMPRALFLLPLVPLAIASGFRRCFGHWALQAAVGVVVAGPLMGLSLPVSRLWEPLPEGERLRVVTFNMGNTPMRINAFRTWAEREKVDVIFVQEGRRDDPDFAAFAADGWHFSRERSIASRFPIVEELPQYPAAWMTEGRYSSSLERVVLETPAGARFLAASLHLPTLRPGLDRLLLRRDAYGLRIHTRWWARETTRALAALGEERGLPVVIGGDFNMPSEDATMAALRHSFRFAFEEAGWGYGYTRPAQHAWVRIDQVLASPEWGVNTCRVGPDFASDHLPVFAEVVLPPATPSTRPQ